MVPRLASLSGFGVAKSEASPPGGCQLKRTHSPEYSLNRLPRMGVPGNDMVHRARSGSSSGRRSSRGRGLFAALGSGEFTPPPPKIPGICWSFLCASSSSSMLGSIYTFSSYSSRIECFRTSSFFGWCIYGARGRG
ncbi:hypothetical protein Taro_013012 [Colocasia esculenta]|uniref:Uncharacterized protein n=1 Tax=Colocasia esculenta TaxID=4460 RepID=A0A843UF67_COLES|nr:hypothetical protein [Colocasia esculenta]